MNPRVIVGGREAQAPFSIVILSRNARNLVPCVRALLANEPGLPRDRIVVVDDGAREDAEKELPGIRWVAGVKPFIFARNANLGIEAAGGDVVLLNDDALLMTPQGFTAMAQAARRNPDFGVISAVTNVAGNPAQRPRDIGLREDRDLAFVCVLIPEATWRRVGSLDERYCVDYGVEDKDYCHRVALAGLRIGIFDHCYVDHSSLISTYRSAPRASRSFEGNYRLFREKWGML